MTDTTISIKDGNLANVNRRVMDEGEVGTTPYNAEHPGQRGDLLAAIAGIGAGSALTVTAVQLTADMVAGNAQVLPAASARRVLLIIPDNPCYLNFSSGQTHGIPLAGGTRNPFSGPLCPTNELFIFGGQAAVGDTVIIATA